MPNHIVQRAVQPKLRVSQPGEPSEADRVADAVIGSAAAPAIAAAAGAAVQRKCAACNEEEEGKIHRKEAGSGPVPQASVVNGLPGSLGGGEPLPRDVRAFFEPRFGQDLSHVRVHTDGRAAESARAVNALAYTVGNDLVFGQDRYAPHGAEGRRLLAHELTHVIQQSGCAGGAHGKLAVNQQGDRYEHEADRVADQVINMPGAGQLVQPKVAERGIAGLLQRDSRCKASPEDGVPAGSRITGFGFRGDPTSLSEKGFSEARALIPMLKARPAGSEVQVHGFGKYGCTRALGIIQFLRQAVSGPFKPVEHGAGETGAGDEQLVIVAVASPQAATAGGQPAVSVQAPEFEAVTPEEAEQLRSAGVHLPQVSAVSADPKTSDEYIDRRITAVGYGIYKGFLLFCEGVPRPIAVPEHLVLFGTAEYAPVNVSVYPDFESAAKVVPPNPLGPEQPESGSKSAFRRFGPLAPGQAVPYAYFRGPGGVIAPTIFSEKTAPRIVKAALDAVERLGKEVSDELVILALGIVGGMLLRASIRGTVKIGEEAPLPKGELEDVNISDPGANALARRIGGRPSVRFKGGPPNEFDAVSDRYVAQTKPARFKLGQDFRNQAKATFETAIQYGRKPYFHFDGPPERDVLRALERYAERYGIDPVIDTKPF
jgi:hypothetical protein